MIFPLPGICENSEILLFWRGHKNVVEVEVDGQFLQLHKDKPRIINLPLDKSIFVAVRLFPDAAKSGRSVCSFRKMICGSPRLWDVRNRLSENEKQWVNRRKSIDNSFSYDFYFLGSAYSKTTTRQLVDRVYVGRGKYKNKYREKHTYNLSPELKSLEAWVYEVYLTGKARKSAESFIILIDERLDGYELVSSNASNKIYKDDKLKLTIEITNRTGAEQVVKLVFQPLEASENDSSG